MLEVECGAAFGICAWVEDCFFAPSALCNAFDLADIRMRWVLLDALSPCTFWQAYVHIERDGLVHTHVVDSDFQALVSFEHEDVFDLPHGFASAMWHVVHALRIDFSVCVPVGVYCTCWFVEGVFCATSVLEGLGPPLMI